MPRNQSEAAVAAPLLSCPACDNSLVEDFLYVEDIPASYDLFESDGKACLNTSSQESYYCAAENQRLECRKCGHEFPIPSGLDLDWV
jgi:uncharacterized protein YbaR (Trm112 family)